MGSPRVLSLKMLFRRKKALVVQAMLAVPGVRKVIPFNTENILCDVNEVLIPDIFDIDPIQSA